MSAALWSIVVSSIGYLFANVVYIFVQDIRKYEAYIIPAIIAVVVACIFIYRHIVKEREKTYGNQ
jgi:membrane protein DedA with SNARE-associated domain